MTTSWQVCGSSTGDKVLNIINEEQLLTLDINAHKPPFSVSIFLSIIPSNFIFVPYPPLFLLLLYIIYILFSIDSLHVVIGTPHTFRGLQYPNVHILRKLPSPPSLRVGVMQPDYQRCEAMLSSGVGCRD